MVDRGRASRETIEYLIQDIKDFIEAVNEEIGSINTDAKNLNEYWDDKQYEEFLRIVEDLSRTLSYQLNALDDVNANLKRKLSILG